jgi:hypothetical protein
MRQRFPAATAAREDTGQNGATEGLLDEAGRGPAPWVALR